MRVVIDLIYTLPLVVALSIVSGFVGYRWRGKRTHSVVQGTIFGVCAVIGMLHPVQIEPGVFFDGRSIMISLCALYFGPLAAVVAGTMALVCRVLQGGAGAPMGILVIIWSGVAGLVFHRRWRDHLAALNVRKLYTFGVIVHLGMIAMMLALPYEVAARLFNMLALPILITYPVATVLVGKILTDQEFQRAALESLKKSEEQHRTTLYSIGDGVITTDAEGHVRQMNAVAEKLTGWTEREAWGKPLGQVFQVINEESRVPVENPGDLVLREGRSVGLANHTLLVARDGTERPIAETGAPIRDGNGGIHGVVLAFRDQTEERARERALRESQERLAYALDGSNEGLWDVQVASGHVYLSPRGCEMLEYPPDVFAAETHVWSDLVHPDDMPATMAALDQYFRGATPLFQVEQRLKTASGSWKWVLTRGKVVSCDSSGKPVRMAGTHGDITDRKAAEADRERLIKAIEQAGESVVVTDANGTIQYVNPAFTKVTGYTREEAVGSNPRILKSGEMGPAFYEDLWRTLLNGGTWKGEFVNRRKDGSLFTEEATITPVRDASGVIVNFVAVKRDLTHEIALEHQYRQAQKMEAVGRLAGGVAHDFNNMLSVILGHAEMLLTDLPPDDPSMESVREIRAAGVRSADLTRQLLAFARKQTIDPKVFDLNDAIGSLLKMLRRLIGEDVQLVWKPTCESWLVKIDPAQLDQIMVNLVVNARDAIAGVGTIVIKTDTVTFDLDYCSRHPGAVPGEYAVLSMSDDGCGMEKHVLDHIFEPFFTTKGVGEGTGLGLATVYGIVKQNDGFIDVQSEPGAGTTFRIFLPRQLEDVTAGQGDHGGTALPSGSETVLLVEDELPLLALAERLLTQLGYRVLAADSPEGAILQSERFEGPIHLLMTDVIMPGMNGRELWRTIAASRADMKCLFMSGYTADVIAARGVVEEGVHFIQKPFTTRVLAEKVRAALDA